MADVVQKAISANSVYNNRSVVSTNPKNGSRNTKDTGVNKYVTLSVTESRMDGRLNQVTYYSN